MTPTAWLAVLIVAGWWTGLARAVFGIPVYAGVLDVGLLALCGWVLLSAIRRRSWRPAASVLAVLIVSYMVLAAVQVLNPNVPSLIAGLEGYRKTAFTMIAFFVVALDTEGSPERFFSIVAVGSLPALLWGIRQFYFPLPIDVAIVGTADASPISFHSGLTLRAYSPTAGPFHLGILAGGVAITSLVLAGRNRLFVAIGLIAGVALGLTLTRGNIIAAFLALCVTALMLTWERRGRLAVAMRGAAIVAALIFGASLGAGLVGTPPNSAVRQAIATPTPTGATPTPEPSAPSIGDVFNGVRNPLSDKNLQYRFQYWAKYVEAFLEEPWVGYGTSSAGDGFEHFYADTERRHYDPHSLYLKPALELGIVGFLLLIAILTVATRASLRSARRHEAVGVVALGLLVLVGVSGITGPMLDAYPFNVTFWACLGLLTHVRDHATHPTEAIQ